MTRSSVPSCPALAPSSQRASAAQYATVRSIAAEASLLLWANSQKGFSLQAWRKEKVISFLYLHFLFPVQRGKSPKTYRLRRGWRNISRVGSMFCLLLWASAHFTSFSPNDCASHDTFKPPQVLLLCSRLLRHSVHVNFNPLPTQVATSKETRRCTLQEPPGIPSCPPLDTLNVPSAHAR